MYKGRGNSISVVFLVLSLSSVSVVNEIYNKVLINKVREGTKGMICGKQSKLRREKGDLWTNESQQNKWMKNV